MSFRVLIPAAGTGSRLGSLTRYVNKALVGVANRPAISHVIEQFPPDAEFVVALGHKGHLLKEFLALAYPDRRFFFAEVSPFEGPGSGLGLSVRACREHLNQPFIFISCDTLVRGEIPSPDRNWMGYADIPDLVPYRTLEVADGRVRAVCEKGEGRPGLHKPYIGLAGVRDHEAFWAAMESGGAEAVATGEAHGLRALLGKGVEARAFDWYDTGTPEALARAREAYKEPGAPNILEKANEAIWFVGGNVIKFSDDEKFISSRVARARGLKGFVPEVTGSSAHMYRYPRAEGAVLSECATLPLFRELLAHSSGFWERRALDNGERASFKKACLAFYKDKTLQRVELFYKNFSRADGAETINGEPMPRLAELLAGLDWDWLADGLPGRFHGDFHFENILWSEGERRFTFLDWRQDFGGSLTTGDIYYDLAKLLHGLIICHELIARDRFSVDWTTGAIRFEFERKDILVACEREFYAWLGAAGYDVRKVRVLTALIYLNIAALHHYPYSLLLYALGKRMLAETAGPVPPAAKELPGKAGDS